jgi:signal transduction histidine kinase/CheY-like chemotaxis protein
MIIKDNNNIITIIDDNETINVINCNFYNSEMYSFVVEKDGLILYCSENNIKHFKLNMVNKKISDVVTSEEYDNIRMIMLESIFTNKQIINETKIKNRIYKLIISPIVNIDSSVKYLLLNLCDVTRSRKIEDEIDNLKTKLEESNSIKTIFLSNISHELRTPMNAIIGFSDLLLNNEKFNDQTERFVKSINYNAKHLDELLSNILDFSRIESKEFDLLYEKFNVNDLLDELSDIFTDVNYKKNLDFVKIEFVKTTDKKIISDYLRLKQVLFNIISNSIKFTDSGHITISYVTDDNFITFKIEDTGIGIPLDKKNKVFDRFWQCDSSSTKKYKGVGLGLSISKSIIGMLDGEIWFESVLNMGTTFYVKLKIEEIKHDIIENKNKINFVGKTVLIIDELPVNYSLLGMYINSLNFNILSATTGEDGIQIYKKQNKKIGLIFLDLNLPDMKTSEIIENIKTIKDCKIITKSDKYGVVEHKLDDVDFHIQNPINKEKLLQILNKIWQK